MMQYVAVVAALSLLRLGCCQNLQAGNTCKLGNGKGGLCQPLQNCEWAKKEIKSGRRPSVCSYDRLDPIVCCPEVRTQAKESKAIRMCREYGKFVYELVPSPAQLIGQETKYLNKSRCVSDGSTFIIGGDPAKAKEFPHMALIGYGSADDISWLCGGSLISPRFVLTAGHCLKRTFKGEPQWVRVGELNVKLTTDNTVTQDVAIVQKIPHPDYKPPARYNDIALLKLQKDVNINDFVRPCCLHTTTAISVKNATASGWGRTDWTNAEGSDKLMKVSLNLYPTQNCVNIFQSDTGTRKLPVGIKEDSMVCAGEKAGSKDTCTGDSGGPLQYILDDPSCMHSIIGVTSFGSSVCGAVNSAAVYTRVSKYVPWIESVVWPGA